METNKQKTYWPSSPRSRASLCPVTLLLPCLQAASLFAPRLLSAYLSLCSLSTHHLRWWGIFWPWKDSSPDKADTPTSSPLLVSRFRVFCPQSKFSQCRSAGPDRVRRTLLVRSLVASLRQTRQPGPPPRLPLRAQVTPGEVISTDVHLN